MNSAVMSVFAGAAVGLPAAFYANVFLGRWYRFIELRNRAKRIVNGGGHLGGDGEYHLLTNREIGDLVSLSDRLRVNGHISASDEVLALATEIKSDVREIRIGKIGFETFAQRVENWIWRLNSTRPTSAAILDFRISH